MHVSYKIFVCFFRFLDGQVILAALRFIFCCVVSDSFSSKMNMVVLYYDTLVVLGLEIVPGHSPPS